MQDRASAPQMRWVALALATLPGLWLAWQGPRVAGWSPRAVPAAILAVVAVAGIAVGWFVERRLAAWSLPAIGSLLWALSTWAQWFAGSQRHGPAGVVVAIVLFFWPPLAVTAVLAAGTCARTIHRECRRAHSRAALALLLLFALAMLAWPCADLARVAELGATAGELPAWRFCLGVFGEVVLWAALEGVWATLGLLGTLALGLPLARRHGAAAALLVVSSLPAWLDPFTLFFRTIRMEAYELPGLGLAGSLEAMTALLALGCLVIPAIGVLLARSERARTWWLVLPPLLALTALYLLHGHVWQALGRAYGPWARITDGLVVLAFWLPVPMAATLYRRIGELPAGEEGGSGDDVFSFSSGLVIYPDPHVQRDTSLGEQAGSLRASLPEV